MEPAMLCIPCLKMTTLSCYKNIDLKQLGIWTFWAEKEQLFKWKANNLVNSLIFTHLATLLHIQHCGCYLLENYCHDLLCMWFFFFLEIYFFLCKHTWTELNWTTGAHKCATQSRMEEDCDLIYATKDANKWKKILSLMSVKAMCFTTSKKK